MNLVYTFKDNELNDFIFEDGFENNFVCKEEVEQVVNTLVNALPKSIRDALERTDWVFEFTNTKDIETLYNIDYKVDGITDFENHVVFIYANKTSLYSAFFHEIGHFVDWYMNFVSKDKRWNTILKNYYDRYNSSIVFQRLGLHTDTKEFKVGEFFAEVINIYLLTNTDVVPKEYKQLKDLYIFKDLLIYAERVIYLLQYKDIPKKKEKREYPDLVSIVKPEDMWN